MVPEKRNERRFKLYRVLENVPASAARFPCVELVTEILLMVAMCVHFADLYR